MNFDELSIYEKPDAILKEIQRYLEASKISDQEIFNLLRLVENYGFAYADYQNVGD